MVSKAGRPSTQGWRDEEQRAATAKMLDARRKRPGSPPGGTGFFLYLGFLRHHQTYLLQFPGLPQTKGGKNGHKEEQRPSLSLESPKLVSQEK